MNCQNHPETPATAYCRNCGKPVCDACRRDAFGTVYCAEHIPAPPPPAPDPAVTPPQQVFAAAPHYARPDVSPGLALFLGTRSEEHTSELQSLRHLVCRLLLEKKKKHK